mmetsp:Transcript_27617/g.49251  ORF Transcript_27617/g.49251 Transcript_27617/m.49251 type:complete len:129 (-) Transcript_27617:829-1215(-)
MADALDVVQEELSRLENAVRHLRRSNAEMKEELTSNGPDRELKEAIEENIVTIAKYVADIEGLKTQLRELGGPLAVPHSDEVPDREQPSQAPAPEVQNPATEGDERELQRAPDAVPGQEGGAGQGVWL